MPQELGLRFPTDDKHRRLYTLTDDTIPDKPTPGVAGTYWYSSFDTPTWDERGRFWIVGKDLNNLGRIRGGHAYCFKPDPLRDVMGWYHFYDQGTEGACVGFAVSRAMSLLNRVRYDARWLYKGAQLVDEWAETPPEEGTSVRAALDVIRGSGHVPYNRRQAAKGEQQIPLFGHGIEKNRWALNVEDFIAAMHSPRFLKIGRAPFLNSWGGDYPHIVYMTLEAIDLHLRQDGELSVITDR